MALPVSMIVLVFAIPYKRRACVTRFEEDLEDWRS